jgi:hypothetical protein
MCACSVGLGAEAYRARTRRGVELDAKDAASIMASSNGAAILRSAVARRRDYRGLFIS